MDDEEERTVKFAVSEIPSHGKRPRLGHGIVALTHCWMEAGWEPLSNVGSCWRILLPIFGKRGGRETGDDGPRDGRWKVGVRLGDGERWAKHGGPEYRAVFKALVGEILGKRDAHAHIDGTIPARGTTVVVAENVGEFLARDIVYGTYHAGQLEWIQEKRLYNMPVARAAEIGIEDEAAANARSVLFLVSGAQGHREKPSVFRIKKGSARKMTRAELEERHGYRKGAPEEAGKEYWVWALEG